MSPGFVIERRYRGPEGSGNGGYTCGMVAGFIDGAAEVTLRKPPPLDTRLEVRPVPNGVDVYEGKVLIAEGRSIVWRGLEVPPPPTVAEAETARAAYAGYRRHAFPTCFVCGTDRDDGMEIHAGKVKGREVWASPFHPDAAFPHRSGRLTPEMVWSALDCPGAWAVERALQNRPVVLGRMAAVIEGPVHTGSEYVAMGWPLGAEGRKLFSGTALFDAVGNRLGVARQTWIVVG
jgi:hypothetical protein